MRFGYIDTAKGFAILLVVVGHVVAREPPRDADWYSAVKATIYLFHMPLFVFLSGLAYGFGFKPFDSRTAFVADIRRRVGRLLAGYAVLGLTIFVGKLVFQQFTPVDNPVRGIDGLADLLLRPSASYASFLWYVYSLSILYVSVPLLLKATRGRLLPLLAATCVFPLLPDSTLLSWNKLQEFSVFFVLGMAAARRHEVFERWVVRTWPWALIAFAMLVPSLLRATPVLRADACLAIVAVMGLLHLPGMQQTAWLKTLGRYTLTIYLFNTVCIGLAKLVVQSTTGWDGPMFVPAFIVLAATGTLVPIFLKRRVFSRIPWLDRIT